ncbi:hypothetical protein [Pollutimonas bauzanensis]|uniref:Uncharacterized protein n=1 Tax=Pollutimonas bauzanensis TaxID=658167 RepID=A0A1M5MM04_9BURK|nr:hypothetical protein [Pollutimonas bauzanensis]SHG78454.1 hypothetical protein SAMN04488135_101263 [Pollutimonas bauzanensis]
MSEEASRIKEVVARGKQRFFELHPRLLQEIEAVTGRDSDMPASAAAEQREIARYRAIAGVAKTMGKDSLMLLLELGSSSKEELDQLVAAQNSQIKKSVGM